MHIKGVDKFRKKLPGYSGKRIILIPLIAMLSSVIGLSYLIMIYQIPSLFTENQLIYEIEPFLPVIGQVSLISAGFFFVYLVWRKRKRLLIEEKESAYQKGIIFGMIGIPLILLTALLNYFPVYLLWQPYNPLTSLLSSSPFRMSPVIQVQLILSLIVLVMGLLTIRKAILTFGFDYMALVYLYYPEESELQNHNIYSVLRHPTYFAVTSIAFGGWIMFLSFYSLTAFLTVLIGLNIHLKYVEEKELIERFGQSYIEYKNHVPALLPSFSNIPKILKFILGID
jgi:protein-S-isoprenylcysteine O-methyltransferase Ste14